MSRVSTAIYLGNTLVEPVFGNQFVSINPFFDVGITPLIDSSAKLFLDTTNPSSYPGTGNNWFDLSGNGNNADVTQITTYWNSGGGGFFDFPGTDYTKVATVTHSTSLNLFNSNFTIMFVGTVDATGTGFNDSVGPFAKDDWNDNPGVGLLINRGTGGPDIGGVSFYLNDTNVGYSGAANKLFTTIGDFFVGHVVRSGSNVQYYRTNNTSFASFTSSLNGNNSNNFVIGRGRNVATGNYKWDGKLAGVGLYNKALSAAERLQNINYFKAKLGF